MCAVPSRDPVEVFISYSHHDEKLLVELKDHMTGLTLEELIKVWRDRNIKAGDEWEERIEEHLNAAGLFLLLLSAKFMASKYCRAEMERAIERHNEGDAWVVPILLKPFEWADAPFWKLNFLPDDRKPVGIRSKRDKIWAEIVKRIRELIVDLPFNNLPDETLPLIGRKQEAQDLEILLSEGSGRLVAIHGPSGSGKTRLAVHVARRLARVRKFQSGICFVPLGQTRASMLLPCAVAKALGIKETEGVSFEESLHQHLRDKQMLILLDGFENNASRQACIAKLQKDCPRLTLLLTSEKSPRIKDARKVGLKPLPPEDAMALFFQNTRSVKDLSTNRNGDAEAVAEICNQLEGIALAIELVAARVRQSRATAVLLKDIESILIKGKKRLDVRTSTLDEALAWIFSLLSPEERNLTLALSIFSGGCTVEAAEVIRAESRKSKRRTETILKELVQSRLLGTEAGVDGRTRYTMHAAVRDFAARQLEDQEIKRLRQRHAELFLALAQEAESKLMSPERNPWMKRLDAEHENLRAALVWFRSVPGGNEQLLELAGSLFWFWNLRAYFAEGLVWLEGALAAKPRRAPARAKALYAAGGLAFLQGRFEAAHPWLEESAGLWRDLGDERRRAYALVILGMVEQNQNERDLRPAFEREQESVAIFKKLGDEWGLALALNDLGNVCRAQADLVQARKLYCQSLRKWRSMNDSWGRPLTLTNLGFLEMLEGDKGAARRAFKEALQVQHWMDDPWGLAETVKYLADLAVRQDDDGEAEKLYRESLDLNRKIGRRPLLVGCLAGLAVVAQRQGHWIPAAHLAEAVNRWRGPVRVMAKPLDHQMYQRALEALESREVEAEAIRRARVQGSRRSLEEAIAYALSLPKMAVPLASREGGSSSGFPFSPKGPENGGSGAPLSPSEGAEYSSPSKVSDSSRA
jgi:predicted ATPase